MPRREKLMPLAFSASQKLDLTVRQNAERLPNYLQQEGRVLNALLDARQIERLSPGHYRYLLADLQVFQLQVKPVVALQIENIDDTLLIRALDCDLEGNAGVDDFKLTLEARLESHDRGLKGNAELEVQVSQPPLLRLIPRRVLESTGESILNGILIGIKARVSQQLLSDFRRWCRETEAVSSAQQSLEETTAMQGRGA